MGGDYHRHPWKLLMGATILRRLVIAIGVRGVVSGYFLMSWFVSTFSSSFIVVVGYFLSGLATSVVIESRRKTAHLTCLVFEERQRWHERSLLYLDTLGVF